MGGKSRKTGAVSKKLIDRIKSGVKMDGKGGTSKAAPSSCGKKPVPVNTEMGLFKDE